jgi:hypothetical protein
MYLYIMRLVVSPVGAGLPFRQGAQRCYASLSVVRLGRGYCGCNRWGLSYDLQTLGIATLGPLDM